MIPHINWQTNGRHVIGRIAGLPLFFLLVPSDQESSTLEHYNYPHYTANYPLDFHA